MRLLLVEDHALVRSGLARLLRCHWPEVGEAGCIQEALEQAAASLWDLVVIDAHLGQEDGLELASRLRALYPRLALMVLSMNTDPARVRMALKLGVRAFVSKDAQAEELVAATLVARRGCLYLDSRVAPAFLKGPEVENREGDILQALLLGLSNQEISNRMSLSVSSVKSEIRALFSRYGVKDRNALLRVLQLKL
ncbi:response regulator transcription factor [bacterium]|nr:response regulator transcription factor [bacterium]